MTQKPKLVLHVGSHKTGTTALQRTFGRSEKHFKSYGILYPKMAENLNHRNLIRALVNEPGRSDVTAEEIITDIRMQAENYDQVLLSSENVYRYGLFPDDGHDGSVESMRQARESFLKSLQSLLVDFDVTILLFLRRVDRFAESLYKEMTFRKDLDEPLFFDDFLHKYRMVFDYKTQIEGFERYFENVDVFSYDKLENGEINQFVCDYLNVPASKIISKPIYRKSASNIGAKFLQKLFETRLPTKDDCGSLLDLFQTQQWLEAFGNPACSLWTSADGLRKFIDRTPGADIPEFFEPYDFENISFCDWTGSQQASAEVMFEKWNNRGKMQKYFSGKRRKLGAKGQRVSL